MLLRVRGKGSKGYQLLLSLTAGGGEHVQSDGSSVEASNFEDGSDFMIVEDSSDSEGEESLEVSEIVAI